MPVRDDHVGSYHYRPSADRHLFCLQAFALFDTDNTGQIDLRELKASLRALGFDVTREQIRQMLTQLGKPLEGSHQVMITVEEFIQLVTPLMGTRDSPQEVEKIFKLFTEDSASEYITFRGLKKVCNELGESLTDNEIQEMIDEADRDGDGKISKEEFYRVMKKRGENPLDDWTSDDES